MGRSEVTRIGAMGVESPEDGAPHDDPLAVGAATPAHGGRLGEAVSQRAGVLVLAAVVVAAAGVLWTMRHLGTRGGLELVDIDIDYPLDAHANGDAEKQAAIIDELMTVGEFAQVPPHHVQMNPFTWKQDPSRVKKDEGPDPEEIARRERMERIRASLASLHVQSVMGGRRPVAKISGELVGMGDTIGEFFTVRSIEGRSVTLATAGGETYVLEAGTE